jgi:hypothetical protein
MGSTPRQYALNLANGIQVFANGQPPSPSGAKQIVLACASYPSTGTASLEYQLSGDTTWRKVPKGTALPLVGPLVLAVFGSVAAYRLTLAGISGGSGLSAWISDIDADGFPPGAFDGLRALTVQSYIEANVKNGRQYEASALNEAVPAGANIDVCVQTAALPVLVKLRKIDFNGAKLTARVYKDTEFTGGTPVPYFNMNLRDPVAGQAQVVIGATINSIGVEAGAPSYLIGSTGQGQSALGSYALSGIERLLAPNSKYALRITNTSAAPQDIATYLTWYEGGTDFPL